jgi:hypothetical protein
VIRKVHHASTQQDCNAFHYTGRYARIMSPQTLTRPKRSATSNRKRKKAGATGWVAWWPLLAGIGITFAAVKMAEILPLMGADGLLRLQLLYPYALLLKQPQLGLAESTSNNWSQIMLYAQWALYGLYITVAMKWKPLWVALTQVAAIHLLGFGVLWLLART